MNNDSNRCLSSFNNSIQKWLEAEEVAVFHLGQVELLMKTTKTLQFRRQSEMYVSPRISQTLQRTGFKYFCIKRCSKVLSGTWLGEHTSAMSTALQRRLLFYKTTKFWWKLSQDLWCENLSLSADQLPPWFLSLTFSTCRPTSIPFSHPPPSSKSRM